MRREAYPADWESISLAVRERAGWKCELCGAPNKAVICRLKSDPFQWREVSFAECEEWAAFGWHSVQWYRPVRVMLTVHHAGVPKPDGSPGDRHDKSDNRPENLQALCQRCHLYADLDIHIANAHRTRRARKLAAGQLELGI
jgi:5-methylcytosine-specific restriction endonuclease McrA